MELLNMDVVYSYWMVFLKGLSITIYLTFIVSIISAIAAVPIALGRLSDRVVLKFVSGLYVEFIRSTPLILQLVYIFYVLPTVGIKLSPLYAAIVGLSLNYSAYISEVYRAGITAIPKSQTEAAFSIGLSRTLTFVLIIFPQAIRLVIPALGNYVLTLFKDTALASVVTVQELTFSGQIIAARNYQYFTVYTITALLYFSVCYPSSVILGSLEKRTKKPYGRK